MEAYLHFAVRVTVCIYVLYRFCIILFDQKLFGLWDRIPVRPKKGTPEPVIMVITEKENTDVVGKTTIVYLEDPELAAKVPVHSEKLEPSSFIGEEPDVSDDDVESDLLPKAITPEEVLEEKERFEVMDDLAPGLDPDFSTGLTFEEMANAIGVLTVSTDNETQIIQAAKTIHSIKNTDLFEFFTNQVSNLDNVEKLMSDCLDDDGIPLKTRKSKQNLGQFDINKFV